MFFQCFFFIPNLKQKHIEVIYPVWEVHSRLDAETSLCLRPRLLPSANRMLGGDGDPWVKDLTWLYCSKGMFYMGIIYYIYSIYNWGLLGLDITLLFYFTIIYMMIDDSKVGLFEFIWLICLLCQIYEPTSITGGHHTMVEIHLLPNDNSST